MRWPPPNRPTALPVAATDPLYILYTSGTTGRPKGVVRDNGGHAVALLWSLRNIYDIGPDDVFWTASDIGWVVGHSYIVYAPLLAGATTVLYEGKPVGTPDAGAFWRVVAEHGVKALFTAPTALRAIKRLDPQGELVVDRPRACGRCSWPVSASTPRRSTGRRTCCDVPVVDHWWQTETGWAICANPRGLESLPIKAGSPTVPMPGYDVQVLDDAGGTSAAGCRRRDRDHSCRCRPERCSPCGATTSGSRARTCTDTPASTSAATAATSTRTATCSSWDAPTT